MSTHPATPDPAAPYAAHHLPELPDGYTLAAMTPAEVAEVDDWAAAEGWNPGLADIGTAWAMDPLGLVALRGADGRMAGSGSIVSYEGRYGFLGLFIVRPDVRGRGLGAVLWPQLVQRLRLRLAPGAAIGIDGVFAMVPYYQRTGFAFTHRDLRFQGIARAQALSADALREGATLVALDEVAFDDLAAYDRRHVPAPREQLLRGWISQPGAQALACLRGRGIAGYAVARPCRQGYKVGPLFADSPAIAELLLAQLCTRLVGEQVQLDVPEPNAAGLALAARFGWQEAFGCARMVNGPAPQLPLQHIFGLTSFEFG
ncbi:MAG: hypothetical protein RL375_1409 [Pseudomonadota bacterium]|jgi:GNAT superfamily N-acetyltransferase